MSAQTSVTKSIMDHTTYMSSSMFTHKVSSQLNPKVKYTIKKTPDNKDCLGRGSFATVFYATDRLGDEYAIKRIELSTLDPMRYDKFMLELDISVKLTHPNIVKCFEVFKTSSFWYIVTEYCNYGTFADLIKALMKTDYKTKEHLCQYYLEQFKNALKYLHKNNIVHRDLKPMNILMTKVKTSDGSVEVIVKLADFGFARYFETRQNSSSGYDDMVSTICGTPIYMAPELLINRKYNTKADMWSFGVIMYELLYGTNPYNFPKSLANLSKAMMEQKIIYENVYSKNCINLMKSLLQVNPEDRIEWEDFFDHKWFTSDLEKEDSDSEEINESEDDSDEQIFGFDDDIKNSKPPLHKTKIRHVAETDKSLIHPKSMTFDYIENYIATPKVDAINIPRGKNTDMPLGKITDMSLGKINMREINNKQTKQSKVKTYEETVAGSVINILSSSISYLFGQGRSY